MVVILLNEQDDAEMKRPLPSVSDSPPRQPLPDLDDSESESSSEPEEQQHLIQESQDTLPSYADVQVFQRRRQAADDVKGSVYASRAKRRFFLALITAILLCSIPLIISLIFYKFYHHPRFSDPSPAEPFEFRSRPPFNRPPEPWRRPGYPPKPRPEDERRGSGFPHPPKWGGPPPFHRGGDYDHPEGARRFSDEGRHWHPPPPNDREGEPLDCSSAWTREPHGSLPDSNPTDLSHSKTYTLDLSSAIFIRSFLHNATGSLRVSLDKQVPAGKAVVQVTANGIQMQQLKNVQACIMRQDNNTQGLRLKPIGPCSKEGSFSITLKLSPFDTRYPGLDTYLPQFSQSFDDFGPREFRYVELGGADSSIDAISLSARYLHVHNSNGTIDGSFSASRRLDISGSSKPITITAHICNKDDHHSTDARITSSQAPIEAKLVVCQQKKDSQERDVRYLVTVKNEAAPVSLQLEHAAAEQLASSSLRLNMTTTESAASLTVDTGFEGRFVVHGDEVSPRVVHEEAKDDQGGVRYMELDRSKEDRKIAKGKVFWDSPAPPLEHPGSDVYVSTTGKGEASLVILGD